MSTGLFAFTAFHTILSLIALLLGIGVVVVLLGKPLSRRWIDGFVITALVTSLTGFLFPFHGMTPAIGVGIVATLVLMVDVVARYGRRCQGGWRTVDAIALVISEYLLVFVAIAQAFQKVPALHALAPTGTEGAFKLAQGVTLVIFVGIGVLAVRHGRVLGRNGSALA